MHKAQLLSYYEQLNVSNKEQIDVNAAVNAHFEVLDDNMADNVVAGPCVQNLTILQLAKLINSSKNRQIHTIVLSTFKPDPRLVQIQQDTNNYEIKYHGLAHSLSVNS